MSELSHIAPLFCPICGDIVEIEDGEGRLGYWCWECDETVEPAADLPKDTDEEDDDETDEEDTDEN